MKKNIQNQTQNQLPNDEILKKTASISAHLIELRNRFIKVGIVFIALFAIAYFFSENVYNFLLMPLIKINGENNHRIIYTGLTEAFFTYIKLSTFTALLFTIPYFFWQIYLFAAPGLYKNERKGFLPFLIFTPFLFYSGIAFAYYLVFPYAWQFFLSFESPNAALPIVFEARIYEYLSLVMHLMIAFGVAFQLPVATVLLYKIGLVSIETLKAKRKYAIVGMFIISAIITPPDVFSQIALALPLIILYEIAIIICNKIIK
ncbi:MAG: twin-arginine translocase subunit TatC [Sphingobacteriia bacterium]|nr:twin-arginine translocase subunit TatC [Sphingobacteriia bacterium]